MTDLKLMTPRNFFRYLIQVGTDYQESGSEATAEDYFEAASRIRAMQQQIEEIPHLEEAAYQAGLVDATVNFK